MLASGRQQAILEFIKSYLGENGYPPTYEEIRTGLDLSTKSLVDHHLQALETAGHLSRVPNTPRGLRLNRKLPQSRTLKVPILTDLDGDNQLRAPALNTAEVLEMTRSLVPDGANLYALKVRGQILADALINDGDIVLLQLKSQANDGELVAVRRLDNNETSFKRIYYEPGGVRLQPVNPACEPISLDPELVQVQGKIITIIRQIEWVGNAAA
jgi:repressor LexA